MPLFTLWRVLDHTLNEQERDGISVRAIGAGEWFPGVLWHRSYYIDEPGRLFSLCAYEGPTLEAVRQQSTLCAVPFMEIREAVEIAGPASVDRGPQLTEGLFMVRRDFGRGVTCEAVARALAIANAGGEVGWIRSYLDVERGTTHCILQAENKDAVREHAAKHHLPFGDVEAVGENHPAFWADVYDSFGLPRHWEQAVERQ